MAQLYLLHEICTNKIVVYKMGTYDTDNNKKRRTEKKISFENNVIQTQMQVDIQ